MPARFCSIIQQKRTKHWLSYNLAKILQLKLLSTILLPRETWVGSREGILLDPRLDEVIFNLEPGKYSNVVETAAGFHIIQLIERDPQRPLDPKARLALQSQAVSSWLQTRRSQSQIQILIP